MRRVGMVLALLALVLTGCTAQSESGDAGGTDSLVEESGAGDDAAGGGGGGGESGDVSGVADVDDGRQVVTEGSVTLTVEQPREAARDAAAIVEQAGGHVQERVEQAGGDAGEDTAWLVVRVPADGLTRVLAELERLGRIDSVELTSTDVTGQAQDLDARIRALRISVTRLEDLLARAGTTSDVVAAESTLTERQADLEALVAQRDRLAERVDMSTVSLHFHSTEGAPAPVRAGFTGGLATGWESLGAAFAAALLVLGVLLPWALVVGALVLVSVAVRRHLQRRHGADRPPTEVSAPAGP